MPNRPDTVLQIRKQMANSSWWSPIRDVTKLFPELLREVFTDLSAPQDEWPEYWLEIKEKMGVTDAEIALAAKVYGKMIHCVLLRGESLNRALERSGFSGHRVHSLVGAVLLDKLTHSFCELYGSTLHKGEHDPNKADLTRLEELLDDFAN